MHKLDIRAALLCGLLVAACGGGGGGNGSGTASGLYGTIQLIGHEPAQDAVQVALDAEITLRFDSVVVLDCFGDEDTWLRRKDSEENVPGTFRLAQSGTTAVFTPTAPLAPETDYVFAVSPLTCDVAGRILERQHRIEFRTFDETPPSVVAANVQNGATGRSRTEPLQVTFGESIAATSVTSATVTLRDGFNQTYACSRSVDGPVLSVQPLADLPGDRVFTLRVTSGVKDRAQNALPTTWAVSFRTVADGDAPGVVSVWPPDESAGVSPLVQPVITFDESMDPLTVEPSSLLFQDEFGSLIAFAVHASPDQRTLRVQPLSPLPSSRRFVLAFLTTAAAVTDVSGNPLDATIAVDFTTGSDATPPSIAALSPDDGQTNVSPNATPTVTFDEPIDPDWIDTATVYLLHGTEVVPTVLEVTAANKVRLTPVLPLDPAVRYTLHLVGGHAGLRDLAGNVLPLDLQVAFTTSADTTLPGALLLPGDGAVGVPSAAHVSIVFDDAMDPATITTTTCALLEDSGTPVATDLRLRSGDRVATLTPTAPLVPGAYYRVRVLGGAGGVRERTGNWLDDDLRSRFRVGFSADTTAPSVQVTVNGIDPARRAGIVLPPAGFTIDVTAQDPELSLDIGSTLIVLAGPGDPPPQDEFFHGAEFDYRTFRTALTTTALTPGTWTLSVRVHDLSGNIGSSTPFTIEVAEPSADTLPFERTQVVWLRWDLDRDGNAIDDFTDDLIRMGLAAANDPAGTNQRMRKVVLDAILVRAYALFGRGTRGEPLGADSVPIRFTTRLPIALPHMQMAIGGFDPQGSRSRRYGDPSTGVLGRAYFDYRNADVNDRNLASSPGLGVFPGEMFLYQAEIHQQVYPSFQTLFAQRFLPLCPNMGGTPVGTHPQDAVVLAAGFDPVTANGTARARWQTIMTAVDDWAAAIGTVLAHEVGHSVGLVAPGPLPRGLLGDSSLHNAQSGATEVMAPSVGYEAMVTLDYFFRDVNLAYLRQRLLLR